MARYRKEQDQELGDCTECWGIYRQLEADDVGPSEEWPPEELVAVVQTETAADLLLGALCEAKEKIALWLPGHEPGCPKRQVTVRLLEDGALALGIQGCGLADMATGFDEVLVLENRPEAPLLRVWGDINRSDATHEILLDRALESDRVTLPAVPDIVAEAKKFAADLSAQGCTKAEAAEGLRQMLQSDTGAGGLKRSTEPVLKIDRTALRAAVAAARDEGRRDAKGSGRAMIFSRGTCLATSGREGQCRPRVEADCPAWNRTTKEIYDLIREVEEKYPEVMEIYIAGGYDAADSKQEYDTQGDYDPWAGSWSLTVWTRSGGIAENLRWKAEADA